jgi:hypothetical protein
MVKKAGFFDRIVTFETFVRNFVQGSIGLTKFRLPTAGNAPAVVAKP